MILNQLPFFIQWRTCAGGRVWSPPTASKEKEKRRGRRDKKNKRKRKENKGKGSQKLVSPPEKKSQVLYCSYYVFDLHVKTSIL